MKAKVKKMNLPNAPAPTLPKRVFFDSEIHHYESLTRVPDIFKEKEPYTQWTQKDLDTIEKMWCEGRLAKEIAPKVGGNIRATQNKISYMISKGLLPKRKTTVTEEECAEIREEKKTMTIPEICRKHNVSQGKVKRIK